MTEITITPSDLLRLEGIIRDSALAARAALKEIQDRQLYKAEFDTFEDYCRERWHWTAQHVRNLIHAGEISKTLPKRLQNIFSKERVLAELGKIPESERTLVGETALEKGDVSVKGIQDAAASVVMLELACSDASFAQLEQLHEFLTGPGLSQWYAAAAEIMRRMGLALQELGNSKHLNRTSFIRWRDRIPKGLNFERAQECVRFANRFPQPISDAKEAISEADAVMRVVAQVGEPHRQTKQNAVSSPASEMLQAICSCRAKITKYRAELDGQTDVLALVRPEMRGLRELLERWTIERESMKTKQELPMREFIIRCPVCSTSAPAICRAQKGTSLTRLCPRCGSLFDCVLPAPCERPRRITNDTLRGHLICEQKR